MHKPLVIISAALLIGGTATADPIRVSIDVSAFNMQDIQLQFALYDNSGIIGDSSALIDNVTFGSAFVGFEGGNTGMFDTTWNPDSVLVTGGSFNNSGQFVMQINEDPLFTPTLTFADFAGSEATTLTFDLDFTGSGTEGFWGYDQLVVSLLDPSTLAPLGDGGLSGFGDVFAIDTLGMHMISEMVSVGDVPAAPVPEPGTMLLMALGVVSMGIGRIRRRK